MSLPDRLPAYRHYKPKNLGVVRLDGRAGWLVDLRGRATAPFHGSFPLRAWGIQTGLPAPEWLLGIGTWLMRTEPELVLKSRRVVPGRLLGAGFQFRYPEWPAAARDLVARSTSS